MVNLLLFFLKNKKDNNSSVNPDLRAQLHKHVFHLANGYIPSIYLTIFWDSFGSY